MVVDRGSIEVMLSSSPVLNFFDERKPITLLVDSSKYGLGQLYYKMVDQ